MMKLFDDGPQDGEDGGLFGALFFGEEGREGLEGAGESGGGDDERLPMGMAGEEPDEHLAEDFAAPVEGTELYFSSPSDDFEGRFHRCDIPSRVPPGILVSRGKIEAAKAVQVLKQTTETLFVGDLAQVPGDRDAAFGFVAE